MSSSCRSLEAARGRGGASGRWCISIRFRDRVRFAVLTRVRVRVRGQLDEVGLSIGLGGSSLWMRAYHTQIRREEAGGVKWRVQMGGLLRWPVCQR